MQTFTRFVGSLLLVAAATGLAHAQEGSAVPPRTVQLADPIDYTVSKGDVLSVVVIDQPSVTGKFTVDVDGTVRLPLINRVPVAGKTLRQAEADLKRLFGDGFFKNPQVVVSLDQFKGRKVFIWGAAGTGTYPLADGETIIEAMVKTGATTASEAVIIRSKGAVAPRMPSSGTADEIIRVNLREVEKQVEQGVFTGNIPLEDGDTIYIPRFDKNRIFVNGQVKVPGAYSVPEGTTVLQAITLAGGITESAALGRIQIFRIVNGKKQTVKVKVDDIVQPGDTIIVRERLF